MHSLLSQSMFCVAQMRIDPLYQVVEFSEPTRGTSIPAWIPVAVAVLAVAGVAIKFIKNRSTQHLHDDRQLFNELCRANHLTRRQRQLLADVARVQKLKHPYDLLIDSQLWVLEDTAKTQLVTPRVQAELLKLRSLLFTHGRVASTPSVDTYL